MTTVYILMECNGDMVEVIGVYTNKEVPEMYKAADEHRFSVKEVELDAEKPHAELIRKGLKPYYITYDGKKLRVLKGLEYCNYNVGNSFHYYKFIHSYEGQVWARGETEAIEIAKEHFEKNDCEVIN